MTATVSGLPKLNGTVSHSHLVGTAPNRRFLHPVISEKMLANGADRVQCKCCPYGCHIDLDFIRYAEDVSAGNYHRRHLRDVKKAKKKMRESMENYLVEQRGQRAPPIDEEKELLRQLAADSLIASKNGGKSDRSQAMSPLETQSVFSDSLENVMSDFEETLSQHSTMPRGSRLADYSSDYEQYARRPTSALNGNVPPGRRRDVDGYTSDFGSGYAVPLIRNRQEPSTRSPTVLKRPDYLKLSAVPKSVNGRQHSSSSSAMPPDAYSSDASESFSSVSSRARMLTESSTSPLTAPPRPPRDYRDRQLQWSDGSRSVPLSRKIYYEFAQENGVTTEPPRGLSGQIGANIGDLARRIHATPNGDRDEVLRAVEEQMSESRRHIRNLESQLKAMPTTPEQFAPAPPRKPLPPAAESYVKSASLITSGLAKSASATNARSPPTDLPPLIPPRAQSVSRMHAFQQQQQHSATLKTETHSKSGRVNFDGFHSIRRGRPAFSYEPSRVDDAYVSDSEAFGDHSAERLAAWRRIVRRPQEEHGSNGWHNGHSASQQEQAVESHTVTTVETTSMPKATSPVAPPIPAKRTSVIETHAVKSPVHATSDTAVLAPADVPAESTVPPDYELPEEALDESTSKPSQETASVEAPNGESALPTQPPVLSSEYAEKLAEARRDLDQARRGLFGSTPLLSSDAVRIPRIKIRRSVGIGTDRIDDRVPCESCERLECERASLEDRLCELVAKHGVELREESICAKCSGSLVCTPEHCEECSSRKSRSFSSTSTNTAPVPAPKPCADCVTLKAQLAAQEVIRASVQTMTDVLVPEPCTPCVLRAQTKFRDCSSSTEKSTSAVGVMANIVIPCEPCSVRKKKQFVTFGVMTDERLLTRNRVDAESMTAVVDVKHASTSATQPKTMHSSTATEQVVQRHASVATTQIAFTANGAVQHRGTTTDRQGTSSIGVSVKLDERANAPAKPSVEERATMTDIFDTRIVVEAGASPTGKPKVPPKPVTSRAIGDDRIDKVECDSCSNKSTPSSSSLGVGDDTVEGSVCTRCKRLDYVFTRNVGVGIATVSDVVCETCVTLAGVSNKVSEAETRREVKEARTVGVGECTVDIRPCEQCAKREDLTTRQTRSHSVDSADTDGSPQRRAMLALVCPRCKCTVTKEDVFASRESLSSLASSKSPSVEQIISPLEGETPISRRSFDFRKPRPTRATALSQAAATKKLLQTPQQEASTNGGAQEVNSFRRGTYMSRSVRVESKKGDSLAYIADKSKATMKPNGAATSAKTLIATRSTKIDVGLKGKVEIKQRSTKPTPPTTLPKLPRFVARPMTSTPKTTPTTNDEEAEERDSLAPLPSDVIRSWSETAAVQSVECSDAYENPLVEQEDRPSEGKLVGDVVENVPDDNENGNQRSSSASSSESSLSDSEDEGCYDTIGSASPTGTVPRSESREAEVPDFEISEQIKEACDVLSKSLAAPASVTADRRDWAQTYLQHEWLKAAARKSAHPYYVQNFIDVIQTHGRPLLHKIVNLCDQNENTALHYAVSHGNFDVVSLLLDSKVCNINKPNKAGYTPVMLAALCPMQSETDKVVMQRLFQMGDVNIKASQHGQTALMLAVSHGRVETTKMLIDAAAGVNIQDEDGSTALMCAAEHGHKDIVKLLLAHSEIDASLADYDGSTALSIAVENGHRDIGVLIYAHLNYARGGSSPGIHRRQFGAGPSIVQSI